jgi:hypothetical protein
MKLFSTSAALIRKPTSQGWEAEIDLGLHRYAAVPVALSRSGTTASLADLKILRFRSE